MLTDLADSGSKIVRDVLIAWPRDQVIIYESGEGKLPAMLEDEVDTDGKARAIRIDNGEFIKDEKGQILHLSPTDVTPVETDARLRGTIQQAMDILSLSAPDPDARRSAVLKLGNSGASQSSAGEGKGPVGH